MDKIGISIVNLESLINSSCEVLLPLLTSYDIPCMALGIVNKNGDSLIKTYGNAQVKPEIIPLAEDFWFDLASLTKVIFTTTTILKYQEYGLLDIHDKISKHIPDLRQYDLNAKERSLTIKNLLAHNSFFPGVEPIYTYGLTPLTMRAYILQREWKHFSPPLYSDINFLLLGILLERISNGSINEIPTPNKLLSFSPPIKKSVATEFCTWRNRIIRGEVHDENAYAFGGASGHAGLFGTINGVLTFAKDFMNGAILQAETLKLLNVKINGTRTLGWEIKYNGWHGGDLCSERTLGHTGFTGTGLWIDMEKGLSWTLLTNYIHPSRHRSIPINHIRRILGETIIGAL